MNILPIFLLWRTNSSFKARSFVPSCKWGVHPPLKKATSTLSFPTTRSRGTINLRRAALEEKSQLRYDSTKWQLSLSELIEGCVAVLHEPLCYYGYEMENTPVKTILEELGRRNDYIFAI